MARLTNQWEAPWRGAGLERRRRIDAYVFDTLAVATILVGSAMVFSVVLEGGSGLVRAWFPALVVGFMLAVAVRAWGQRQ